jgi:hypothetical protein
LGTAPFVRKWDVMSTSTTTLAIAMIRAINMEIVAVTILPCAKALEQPARPLRRPPPRSRRSRLRQPKLPVVYPRYSFLSHGASVSPLPPPLSYLHSLIEGTTSAAVKPANYVVRWGVVVRIILIATILHEQEPFNPVPQITAFVGDTITFVWTDTSMLLLTIVSHAQSSIASRAAASSRPIPRGLLRVS